VNAAMFVDALGVLASSNENEVHRRLEWLLDYGGNRGPVTRAAVLRLFSSLADRQPDLSAALAERIFKLAFEENPDGTILGPLSNVLFALYRREDPRAVSFAEVLIDRCAPLPMQTCRRVFGKSRHLLGLIIRRMNEDQKERLLERVPGLNRYLARMIIEGVMSAGVAQLSRRLRAIIENSRSNPEVIGMTARFLEREVRRSDIGKWDQLHGILQLN
jgi:hypothetical protein